MGKMWFSRLDLKIDSLSFQWRFQLHMCIYSIIYCFVRLFLGHSSKEIIYLSLLWHFNIWPKNNFVRLFISCFLAALLNYGCCHPCIFVFQWDSSSPYKTHEWRSRCLFNNSWGFEKHSSFPLLCQVCANVYLCCLRSLKLLNR